ncbi:hypothetical protein F6V30_14070 [Oryzomonas sagensis]|uniref:Uncharacterized protein n=1 Tax=Oryzomonas sagensis TaxID=2603857 RepID=A0ABQ6TL77_9BACT|nr:hypothetical protein [Oryzomonas sagensis]KAB0668960.1 hypothetical protein F6V30_14070 [Oryzomonas sagensis]
MQEKPTGYIARCRCGAIVGALDYGRTNRNDAGKILGKWLAGGNTVEPRFGTIWMVKIESCGCDSPTPAAPEGMKYPVTVTLNFGLDTQNIEHIQLIEKQLDVALLSCGYARSTSSKTGAQVVFNYLQCGIILEVPHEQ